MQTQRKPEGIFYTISSRVFLIFNIGEEQLKQLIGDSSEHIYGPSSQ